MIVLPISEESRSGRAVPWVTLLFAAACLAVFLHARQADTAVDGQADALIEEAWDYFVAHPYVRVEPDAAAMLGAADVARRAQAFRLELARSGSPELPEFVRRHDQMEFNAIMERVYSALARHSFHRLGFFPGTIESPDHTLLSYVLVHDDWLHLAANLLIVVLAGLFLEEVWGRTLFPVFLAGAAASAAAGYAYLDPDAAALGGASGVAAALGGAFFVRFAGARIRFQYFYVPPLGGRFTARGWIVLPLYGGAYLAADHVLSHGLPWLELPDVQLATWAHVGGLAFGVAFALLVRLFRIEELIINPVTEKRRTTRSNPVLERALEAREAGRVDEAVELLAAEVARHSGNLDACLAYWDAASAAGEPARAADALLRVLRQEVADGARELARIHWKELTQRVPEARVDAPLELHVAQYLIEGGEFDLATWALRRIVEGRCGAVSAPLAHRVARTAQDLDADLALAAARKAAASRDLEPGEREDVERLVRQLEGVSEREHEAAAAPAVTPAGTDARGFFSESRDLHPDDPSEVGLSEPGVESGAAADGAGDGDVLGAAPFELDDLEETRPPAASATESAGMREATGARELDLEPQAVPAPAPVFAPAAPARPDVIDAYGSLDPEALGATAPPDLDASDPGSRLDGLMHDAALDGASMEDSLQTSLAAAGLAGGGDGPAAEAPGAPPVPEATPEPAPAPALEPTPGQAAAPEPPAATEPAPALEPAVAPEPVGEVEAEEAGIPLSLGPLEADLPRPARALKVLDAIPLSLGETALTLDVGERGKATLGLERIDAVAVAGVRGLRPRPVVVIDLVTNWLAGEDQPLKVVRLRSDRFDPRRLVEGEGDGTAALLLWISRVVERSGALQLPDPAAAAGDPFRMCDALADYHRDVLCVRD